MNKPLAQFPIELTSRYYARIFRSDGRFRGKLFDGQPTIGTEHLKHTLIEMLRAVVGDREIKSRASHNTQEFAALDLGEMKEGKGVDFFIKSKKIASFTLQKGVLVAQQNQNPLTIFETRYLADTGEMVSVASKENLIHPRTDLHTHLAGCIIGKSLLPIAKKHNVLYPTRLLDSLGISYPLHRVVKNGKESSVRISSENLTKEEMIRLEAALSIPIDRKTVFTEMENIYARRFPIFKKIEAFEDILRCVARDYQKMGVDYAELSFASIEYEDFLKQANKIIPEIERETGVKLRFLVGISRHNDKEWSMDVLERVQDLKHQPYIVGIDFNGHEINPTHDFVDILTLAADWADKHNPGMVIQIHAGENPLYPQNINEAIRACEGKNVQIRIGHGLYGVDHETMELLKKPNITVQFNLSSNLSLNNIDDSSAVPIKQYIDQGIHVTLGSDGYGIYQTTMAAEVQAATIVGLNENDVASIRVWEDKLIELADQICSRKMVLPDAFEIPPRREQTHFLPEIEEKKIAKKNNHIQKIKDRLAELNIEEIQNPIEAFGEMVPILISGASQRSWPKVDAQQQSNIEATLTCLAEQIDSSKYYFITRGIDGGVDGVLHRIAKQRGFKILGTLISDTDLENIHPDITHAMIQGDWRHDRSAYVLDMVKDQNGIAVFIGGGNFINDEIQMAANNKMEFFLMKGPSGVSHEKAKVYVDRTFENGEELCYHIKLLASTNHKKHFSKRRSSGGRAMRGMGVKAKKGMRTFTIGENTVFYRKISSGRRLGDDM